MARPRKYKISLTDDELKILKSVMRKKKTSKTVRNRCQIIIDLDEARLPIQRNFILKKGLKASFHSIAMLTLTRHAGNLTDAQKPA